MARKGKDYNIPADVFIKVWMSSQSIPEVRRRLSAIAGEDVPESSIRSRSAFYRKKGVNLPRKTGGRARLDIDKLNDIIENMPTSYTHKKEN